MKWDATSGPGWWPARCCAAVGSSWTGPGSSSLAGAVRPGTLVVSVVDDGHGGADPAGGTGLAGLAARLEAIDGTLEVVSPAGGPTTVRMTCAT